MLLELSGKHPTPHVVDGRTRCIEIEQGILGLNAVFIGAATFVYEEAFKLPVSY